MTYRELWRTIDQDNRDEIDAAVGFGQLEEVKVEGVILWCLEHEHQAISPDHCSQWDVKTLGEAGLELLEPEPCRMITAEVILRV